MTSAQKNLAPAATGDQADEKLPTAISTTDNTAPRYYQHETVRVVDGIRQALCGHTRTVADADRIVAELGDAWHSTPKCPNCAMLRNLDREFTARRQRAEAITEFVLRYLDNEEGK